MGKGRQSRVGFIVLAAAVALVAVGGSAAGLGAPVWLAGAAAAVSALIAGILVDRFFHVRDDRAAARERVREVLDELKVAVPWDHGDVLGLLRADRSPAPFRGRRRELQQLADWCGDDRACPVAMVSGGAGVGKSRLVLEFGLSLPDDWTVGWLHAETGQIAVSAVRAAGGPTLILIDDADGRADLVPLLDAVAEEHEGPATRVIMVTRSAIGLRAALASGLDERHASIVTSAVELDLMPEGGQDDLERWFVQAVGAFAAVLNVALPTIVRRFHAGRSNEVQPMVVLQAQALVAVLDAEGRQPDPRDLPFGDVAEALMKHEKRWWRAMASTWEWGNGGPLPEVLQERSVTALALLGAGSGTEAEEILRRVPELRDGSAERLSAITSWIWALYTPGPDHAPRIQPDMIGEWFVVSQLMAHPALRRSLRTGLTDAQATRVLSFLARAADHTEDASQLFEEFAAGSIRRQILAAVQAAMAGEAGRRLLDAVVAKQIRSAEGWTLDQLNELEHLIPRQALLLVHVTIADLTITLYRQLAADNPAAYRADLAMALNNLGDLLGDLGRYQDALAAAEEAVALRRALAANNPAYQADLATALFNLGNPLGHLGRYQDALTATEEAVALHRTLAVNNPPHRADLAIALNNLSNRLGHLSRYQDALTAANEAVALHRTLAANNPPQQVKLARTLSNLGNHLSDLSRYQEALTAANEAVALHRTLAANNPAHQADLATALNNLGNRLGHLDRYQDALTVTEEAVALRRTLPTNNPAAYQAGLASALNNLAGHLYHLGRYQDALTATEEAVALRRTLAADNPGAYQADLASTLNNLSVVLAKLGEEKEALAAKTELVRTYKALASRDPDLYEHQYRLNLGALQQEYVQRGMQHEAILRDLVDPPLP